MFGSFSLQQSQLITFISLAGASPSLVGFDTQNNEIYINLLTKLSENSSFIVVNWFAESNYWITVKHVETIQSILWCLKRIFQIFQFQGTLRRWLHGNIFWTRCVLPNAWWSPVPRRASLRHWGRELAAWHQWSHGCHVLKNRESAAHAFKVGIKD